MNFSKYLKIQFKSFTNIEIPNKFLKLNIKIGFVILLILVIQAIPLLVPNHLLAQVNQDSSISFAISPPSFDFSANPGESIKNSIKVENLSNTPISISAKPESFVAYGESGQVSLTEDDSSYSIQKWITISTPKFNIPAKSFALVEFIVNIPLNIEPGSHYGAVVFSRGSEDINPSNGAGIEQQIASLILIKIPGDTIEEANLENFETNQSLYTSTEIMFSALIKNTGTLHFKPFGQILIKDFFGNTIQTLEVPGKNILPNSKRSFELSTKFENIGYYKAELQLFYKNGEGRVFGESSFISLNFSRTVPTLLLLLVVTIAYAVFKKRINKAFKVILKGE